MLVIWQLFEITFRARQVVLRPCQCKACHADKYFVNGEVCLGTIPGASLTMMKGTSMNATETKVESFKPTNGICDAPMVRKWPEPGNAGAKVARYHAINTASTCSIREDVLFQLEHDFKSAYGRLEPDVKKAMEKGTYGTVNTRHTWPDEPPVLAQLAVCADAVFKLRKHGGIAGGDEPERIAITGHLKVHIDRIAEKLDNR